MGVVRGVQEGAAVSDVHICQLSVGIDELPRKQQRSRRAVARVLVKAGRFSVFEATANSTIAATMDALAKSGWFVFDPQKLGYPWTVVSLTKAGAEALDDEAAP